MKRVDLSFLLPLAAIGLLCLGAGPARGGVCTNGQTSGSYLGVGYYTGTMCPGVSCSPNVPITSPAMYVSFPNSAGICTIPAGWLEAGTTTCDADAGYPFDCTATTYTCTGIRGSIVYDDGEVAYTGNVLIDMSVADTSVVALPTGSICCWKSHNSYTQFKQPKQNFIYRIRIRSCTSNYATVTTRLLAYGCDGCIEDLFNGEPNCTYYNGNWINMTVSGF